MAATDFLNRKFSHFVHQKNQKFYLLQSWSDEESSSSSADEPFLKLILTDCTNYWTGTFSKEEVEKSSNMTEYALSEIKLAFNQAFEKETKQGYLVNIVQSKDFAETQLVLKRVSEEDIKVEIISLKLHIIEDPSPKDIFDFSIYRMEQLEASLKSVKKNLKQLTSDRNEALDDCRKLVKEKEEMESDLYQKFICILNEKKARIRELDGSSNGVAHD